uniref:Transcription activation suppressor family member 2 n=1 Tax=Pundamilia nyererei TaxID=303518 RepID=A0A3B4F1F2_9CICH
MLLFCFVLKANALRETGVLTGNSTCTTLGDPSKGVYISMYSDCLDLNRWYHGKSGYIAIIRLTKGKVKRVSENYTQNFTAPTVGLDCHVSEQFPSVSAQTSSFLAFERTQCYMYELLDGGSNATAQSPSAACPFAIVLFSYTDTKATILQIGRQLCNVGLRSKAGALLPAKLPPVVNVDWVISMLDLRQLLPRAIFETCFTGEVFLDGLYCSLYELVSTEAEETNSLVQLLWDIKEKDLALVVLLRDGGFFILLHSSHFLSYDDAWSCASEVLQGLFVFPDPRVVMRDTKFGQKNPSMTSEILRILPVLSYAEGEAEKTPIDPSEELCEVLAQHMQSYTALINPGLTSSPSREVSMFPFQYDVPDTHLYSSPEWTDGAMQSFRSYLSRPTSFQLPVSRASEILAAGQEERRREDLDDDVYICISSPEEAPQELTDPVNTVFEDTLSDLKSSENVETSVDNVTTSTGAQDDLAFVPHNVVPNDLQLGASSKDNEKSSDLSELNKTDDVVANNLTPPTSDDLPAELIVSITSAEQSVSNETLNLRAKLQAAEVNSLCDETGYTQKLLNIPQVTSFTETKLKLHTGGSGGLKKASKASVVPSTLQTVKTPVENDNVNSLKDEHTKEIPDHPQLSNPSNWRKLQRRKRKCGKLSPKNRKLRSAMVALPIAEEKKTDPEHCPLRRKTERWDLKPIISECGKILVPHGSTDFVDQIKSFKDKLQSNKNEECSEKMLLDAPVNADDVVKSDPESCTAPETAVEDMQAANIVEGGNDLQNVTVSDVNPEKKISRESNYGNSSLPLNPESNSSNNEPTDSVSSQAVQEKHSENLSPEKCPTKSEFLLRKLKSVLLRGKRKTDLVTEDTAPNTPRDTEPCLKKSKGADTESEALTCNDKNTPTTNAVVTEVQKVQPVDPLFAFALGLTPKVIPENLKKTEDQDSKQKTDTAKTQEQMIQDKQPQIFDNSVRKTEKMNRAYSPADALNLLADLALSANNDQAPPQPNPSFERKPETSLKKSDLKKDLTSAEQESVLHALLRQPADRSTQPHESPAPSHLVVNGELVGLVSKEHAYSLPPSSSLLLGLPGTSLVSDSSRLLHHDQTMYGFQTLQPSVGQEDRSEYDRTPEYLKKRMACRQKFRYSRTFVNMEGCIKITRHWQENYDFNLDSKFTSDPKDKTIVRALHGPWDFSIQDTNEEVRLIVHMWIGLFYSRSTPRFFHVESNFAYSCSEENDSLGMTSAVVSGLTIFEHKDTAASCPSVPDTSDPLLSNALDLIVSNTNNVCHGLPPMLCADGIALADGYFISENNSHTPLGIKSIYRKPATKKISPQKNYLRDEAFQSAVLLVSDGSSPMPLVKDSFEMESQNKEITDCNNVQSNNDQEDQKIKSTEEEVKDDKEQFQCQVHSPLCEAPKASDGQVAFTEEADFRTNKTNEGLNKGCIAFESPFTGMNPSEKVIVLVKDDSGQSNNDHEDQKTKSTEEEVKDEEEQFQHKVHSPLCEVPNTSEVKVAFTEETDFRTDETNEGWNKSCISDESPFTEIDHLEKVGPVDDNLQKTFEPQPHSPQCKFPKRCETEVAFTKEESLREEEFITNKENEGLGKGCTGIKNYFIGIHASEKVGVQVNDDSAISKITFGQSNRDCEDQETMSTEDVVKNDKEQFQHQPHLPKCESPKLCEAQVAFTEEADFRTNETNEELDKSSIAIDIPFTGRDPSERVTVQVKDDSAIHKNTFGQSNNDHEDQETVSTEEVKDLKQQFQHEVHSPPCEVRKICEAQVASTKETDLRTNEGLTKSCTGVEIPFIGLDRSEELIVQVKDNTATFQRQLRWKIPKMCEANMAFAEKTDVGRDKKNDRLDKRCTEDEIPCIGMDASGKDAVLAKVDNATGKEQFQCQPQSLLSEVPKIFEAQVTFTKEMDLRAECKTNEGLDKNCSGVEIPLIGIDSSEKISVHLHGSHPQGKSGEVVQGQEEIPFISDSSYSKAALTSEICSTSQACSQKEEPCKMLLLDINESYGPVDFGMESDDRCPTPTIDEKPYGYPSCSSPGKSNSALSSSITGKNLNRKCLNTSSAPVNGELPCEKKLCHSSIVKTDSSLHQILHPDLEARTLRVLQSIDKFLSKSNHIDKSCQIETPKMKESVAQSPEPSSKCTPSSLAFDQPTVDFKDKKIGNEKSALVSSSTSQDLHIESSDNLLVSPFKSKLEEVLGVKLNIKKTDSVPQEYFERVCIQETLIGQDGQFPRNCPSELFQVIKPSLDQERPKPTLQSNVNQESRAYNHRPVLAVKPSKNDECQADYFLVDTQIENSLKNNPPKTSRLEYSKPTSVLSEKRTNAKSKGCSERLNDNQDASQLSFKTTWLPVVGNSRSNSFPSYQYQRKDISKFDMNLSLPPPMESFESAKSSSKRVDEIQGFLTNGLAQKVEQTVRKNIEMDLKDPSSAAASFIDQINSDNIDKSLVLGPQSSLVCTVYNNSQKRSYSFLEQVSRRCIQDDLTQASVEQESLIFSEQMKQALKKSERRPTHQEDSHDKIRLSCTSPLTINFSNLDEQEDSLDHLGTSLIGQKIKVDLSNRKDATDKNEEKMICPGELSEGKDNTVEHDWVSDVTVECARLYEAKMQDVCAFKKVSAKAKHFRRSCTKTEPSNHFDFCEQMKKEMDKTFRTNLNSVVKKSCRTKYRFYMLATSEDVFFEQTKLEAEGHTPVQPSEFFPGDDCSSSLIIILKNEDIAEHICEVPHLLELKKSRHVQFAGIDEPDDVLNLTHQELFMQGGFIMFDRTALDALSLCNMKKVSEILLELSKMGKWKWMLHYRDSRRLKENARLSAESKEKKHFLYWGQEAGILEVLPYHDCDQMSKDQPDYLTCLVRQQVQKISSRFLVFITATDGAFESNGILAMTTESFLTKPLSEMFTV